MPEVGTQKFVCFIETWVDGLDLLAFLDDYKATVDSSLLLAYVEGMAAALNALQAEGLRHDDLHAGNVMLERPAPGSLRGEWTLKVVDMGSLKPRDVPTKKEKDDHRHFADQIVTIINTILSKKQLSASERYFVSECTHLVGSMLDEDESVALREPRQIRELFELAHSRVFSPRASEPPPLQTPFEYISAEHIADDRLLVDIFAKSCPWLDKVAGPDPCLVTGPRGCGKSTIFRWLSLKAHLHKPAGEFDQFRIAGFYVSCSSDLQNRLSWIRTDRLAQTFQKEIIHYFNLLVTREVVLTLCLIAGRKDSKSYWGLGQRQERAIRTFLKENIRRSQPLVQGVSPLRQSLATIEAEMFDCHVQMLRGLNLSWTLSDAFLGDLTATLSREMSFFQKRQIAFLVDDYSTHRIPAPVQVVLNRVVWERRPTHIFKLSSEKYGTEMNDAYGATVDITREMVEIDCGREYVALDDQNQRSRARTFAADLLENRLRAAKYCGSPEELLGHSQWPSNSLAKAIRDRDRSSGRTDDHYHGLECIADLCSGDVSTLLLVYRWIFEKGGVNQASTAIVPKKFQHQAIESVSRKLLEDIRHHYPHGPDMHTIVQEFGNLVRRILVEGKLIKKGDDRVVPQCPRIEVDKEAEAYEQLTAKQQDLARELVRRAVFIEMEPGRSRHRFVPTLRWQLRRVYLPAFGAALHKNDAIKWSPSEFKFFLSDPVRTCQREWEKRPKGSSRAERRNPDEGGLPFGEGQPDSGARE
ncbi:MAG: hypothetical protein ACLQOO_27180 [Terriglobia bacterium]